MDLADGGTGSKYRLPGTRIQRAMGVVVFYIEEIKYLAVINLKGFKILKKSTLTLLFILKIFKSNFAII